MFPSPTERAPVGFRGGLGRVSWTPSIMMQRRTGVTMFHSARKLLPPLVPADAAAMPRPVRAGLQTG